MEGIEAAEGMAEEIELLAWPRKDLMLSRKGICCAPESAGSARRSVEGRILRLGLVYSCRAVEVDDLLYVQNGASL